jgi:hypothetical protein
MEKILEILKRDGLDDALDAMDADPSMEAQRIQFAAWCAAGTMDLFEESYSGLTMRFALAIMQDVERTPGQHDWAMQVCEDAVHKAAYDMDGVAGCAAQVLLAATSGCAYVAAKAMRGAFTLAHLEGAVKEVDTFQLQRRALRRLIRTGSV